MIRRAGRASSFVLIVAGLAACGGDDCPVTVYDYCTTHPVVCPMIWAHAQDPAKWPCHQSIALKVCQDVWIAEVVGPEPGDVYYYDPDGAGLYRIEGYDASTRGAACLAGEGEVFDCDAPTTPLTGTKGCP